MSYNGSGTFNINTAGQPVVDGTVISSSVFNALTADLGTGLTTAITKDGQTTPTANIPLGTFKITGLGAGTAATDAVRMSQLQAGGTTFLTAAGTDTITATATPSLTAYATGNLFTFVVAVTNTGAVTLNIDGLGAKAVTRDGTTALAANDLVATEVVIVGYDGTRFQVLNPNAATNYRVSGTLGVTGVATMTAAPVFSSATASRAMFTDGSKALVSNAITGTGNVVMSASPTLTGTIGAAALTLTTPLGVSSGGTGLATLTSAAVLLGNGTSTVNFVSPSSSGNVLTSNGTAWTSATPAAGGATISNDTSTATDIFPLFASATSGVPTTIFTSNAKLLYKPSTGDLQSSQMIALNGLVLNATTVATSYTIASGYNAMSVGPVTISSGIVVTVSSGQRWLVL